MAGCRSRRGLRSGHLPLRGGDLLVGEPPGGMELAQLLQLLEIDGGRGSRGRSRCRGRLGLLLGCGGAFRVGLVVARLLLGLLAGPLLLLVVADGTGGAGDDGGGGGRPPGGGGPGGPPSPSCVPLSGGSGSGWRARVPRPPA